MKIPFGQVKNNELFFAFNQELKKLNDYNAISTSKRNKQAFLFFKHDLVTIKAKEDLMLPQVPITIDDILISKIPSKLNTVEFEEFIKSREAILSKEQHMTRQFNLEFKVRHVDKNSTEIYFFLNGQQMHSAQRIHPMTPTHTSEFIFHYGGRGFNVVLHFDVSSHELWSLQVNQAFLPISFNTGNSHSEFSILSQLMIKVPAFPTYYPQTATLTVYPKWNGISCVLLLENDPLEIKFSMEKVEVIKYEFEYQNALLTLNIRNPYSQHDIINHAFIDSHPYFVVQTPIRSPSSFELSLIRQ